MAWNPIGSILDERDYIRSVTWTINDLYDPRPGTFKRVQDREFQMIVSMSKTQVINYGKYVLTSRSNSMILIKIDHGLIYTRRSFHGLSGPDAAAEYGNAIISILMKLKDRLDQEIQIFRDIKNVRKVMVSGVSLSDHTVLFCVHEHMVKMSKTVNVSRIRRYLSRLNLFLISSRSSRKPVIAACTHLHLPSIRNEYKEQKKLNQKKTLQTQSNDLNLLAVCLI